MSHYHANPDPAILPIHRSPGSSPDPQPRIGSAVAARFHDRPSWIILIELFIGLGWLRAAVEKIINPDWWNGTVLDQFTTAHAGQALPWYQPFLDHVVSPNMVTVCVVVALAQIVAGATLVAGRRPGVGIFLGAFLNLHFVAAGAVNPSIFYLICQAVLLLWLLENRTAPTRANAAFAWIGVMSASLLVVAVPFVSTIDPSQVIEDPAAILAFFAILMALSSRLGRRARRMPTAIGGPEPGPSQSANSLAYRSHNRR